MARLSVVTVDVIDDAGNKPEQKSEVTEAYFWETSMRPKASESLADNFIEPIQRVIIRDKCDEEFERF
ncbi:hypothetical protein CSA56_10090 [candidate division KSB3 bacterium]|uniref:Uncharacterized protein n=1 Tax=candidate division KSB3 bacterium TaxID=2044937 RepID=A0A2G6KDV7_9BACT|nr:MAG: hypothetical protein CSA56_10090 [candidate division KSB3 bacterium]